MHPMPEASRLFCSTTTARPSPPAGNAVTADSAADTKAQLLLPLLLLAHLQSKALTLAPQEASRLAYPPWVQGARQVPRLMQVPWGSHPALVGPRLLLGSHLAAEHTIATVATPCQRHCGFCMQDLWQLCVCST
jgi:hypothetical protein